MLKFGDISTMEMTPEEEIVSRASYVSYNEGEMLYDGKVLKTNQNAPYVKSQYLGESYAEKEFVLTETLQVTKYGTYVRVALTDGRPRKRREVKCYKYKG